MKKFGFLIFAVALIAGVIVAKFVSFGSSAAMSPFNFVFSSKIQGSGDVSSESRNIENFNGLRVGGVYKVYIKKDSKKSVRIEADNNIIPLITTRVSNGVLSISSKKRFSTRNAIKVYISTPEMETIRSSGVARIVFENVGGEDLKLRTSGASKITLKGNVENLSVRMSGASRIDAKELTAKYGQVRGSGASRLSAHFDKKLKARVSGASSVNYKGEAEISKKVSGAGSLNKN